jgi:chromatin segregation and condensation protein Rec8/ScpA/Scc1 (kleisin family)
MGDEELMGDFGFANSKDTQDSGIIDTSALDFLGYATTRAQEKGYTRSRDRIDRRWIDFKALTAELNDPTSTKRFVSEAFMHVLVLATKNVIAVEQEGIANNEPFGTIRIGLTLPEQDDEMADELA